MKQFIKIFTLIPLNEINEIVAKHRENPSARILQKELAKYMTCLVHSENDYNKAVEASNILFGKATKASLAEIDEDTLLAVMKDVRKVELPKNELIGMSFVELASNHVGLSSKTEMRKLIKGNGFSVNKLKLTDEKAVVSEDCLIDGKYILLQKGKKDYSLVISK